VKKKALTALVLVFLLLCLPSCPASISAEDYNALQSDLENAQREIDELTAELAALQAGYDGLLGRLGQSTLGNPNWAELKAFLEQDDTNELLYTENSFDCTGFAITLRDNAWIYGLRCAYVEIGFAEGGHALNAFQTTDKGLIYVDNTNSDKIAYVGVNKAYGTIPLDGVKFEYIACDGEPDEFWGSLTYTSHPNPFSYDYYLDYQRRYEFYHESVAAYNEAVDAYNRGSKKWSYSELGDWLDNLEALEEDLGSIFYTPMGVVKSLEVYWN